VRAKSKDESADALAVRLAVAFKRLYSRLREAALASGMELPITQLAIIKHLRDHGPTTAAVLAVSERMSHQAIAQNLAALKQAGFVRTAPDPTDGRKSLVHVTAAGGRLFESAIAARNAWLTDAIEHNVPAGERAALERAIGLLERLAAADRPRPSGGR
jgi:DNA-binding MarR family transcriptional regulator